MAWKEARRKLVKFLLQSILVLSIGFGLFPFKYVRNTREIQTSRAATYYCLFFNVLILVILTRTAPSSSHTDVRFLIEKPLNLIINVIDVFVNCLALLVTVLTNWIERKKFFEIYSEILDIKRHFFTEEIENDHFDRLVIYRCTLTLFKMCSSMFAMYSINPTPSYSFIILMALVLMLQTIVLLLAMHFYLSVLCVVCYLEEIEKKLIQLHDEMHLKTYAQGRRRQQHLMTIQSSLSAAAQIDVLVKLYLRLQRLSIQINQAYQLRVLLHILSFIIDLIVHGFYLLVLVRGKILYSNWLKLTLYGQIIIASLCDFHLIITICEHLMRSKQKTLLLLRRFNDFGVLQENLARNLEIFSLNCSCLNLRIRICGLFDLNQNCGHNVLSAVIMYLLVLIQFDYKNL